MDKPITHDKFEQNFYNSSYGSDSFYDFYVKQVDLLKGKLAHNTIRVYNSQIVKLREFKKEATFNDIDLNFITAYEGFIKSNKGDKKGNNQNTVTKSIKCIKSILNRAVDQGIIKENPIKKYKLKQIQGHREFFTPDELIRLEDLYYENSLKGNRPDVLRYFLFSCYTGLSYMDIKKLKFNDIKEEEKEKYISTYRGKSKIPVKIPLTKKAKELIPKALFKDQLVFKVQVNQSTNRHLKKIMETAKINKHISYHCSRHTFATLSGENGIPIQVVSKILGHTNIRTTMIYMKFQLSLLTKEMKKWD